MGKIPLQFRPNLRRFEASVDGRFNFEPEVRLGFNGKLELPKDKQKIDLVELDGITVVFYIGYVPFCVDFNPSLYLKLKAEVEGKATMGVKYEFDSWFKGGILYEGYGDPRGISESKVTKSKVSFIKPTAEFNASAGVGLMFGCEMIIDKLVGPELAVGPQLKADAGLTLTPFEKDPVNFEASVDFGLTGEVGAKLKVWKWDIAEWNVDLDFGLNWNIYKYPKDNSKGNKNAENRSNDDEVQKNIEEINEQGLKLIEFNERQQLGKKLSEDAEVMEYTQQYLHATVFNFKPYTKKSQKKAIISSQLDEFATKYGRAPKDNDADFQTLKSMTIEKIKTIEKKELYKLFLKY